MKIYCKDISKSVENLIEGTFCYNAVLGRGPYVDVWSTWQSAEGNDLASKFPRSQSYRTSAWCAETSVVRHSRESQDSTIASRSWSILFTSLVGDAEVVSDWCMFPKQSFPFNALAQPYLCCFGSLPARVDKDGSFFHLAEEGLVAQSLGLWRQGAGNYYEVTLRHKCVQGNCPAGRRGGGIKQEERKYAQTYNIIRFSIFVLTVLASLWFPYQTLHSPQQHGPWLFSQSREVSSLQRAWVSELWPCLNTNTSSYSPTNTAHWENTIMSHAARQTWQDRIQLQRDLVICY